MVIQYEDIFTKCQDLTSFEGRRITTAEGDHMYPDIHLTEQDKPIIRTYTDEAAQVVLASVRYAFLEAEYGTTGITFTSLSANVLNNVSHASKVLEETLAMYVMQHWLEDKSVERSGAYKLMFENMLASFTRLAYRKHAPKLEDYDD